MSGFLAVLALASMPALGNVAGAACTPICFGSRRGR